MSSSTLSIVSARHLSSRPVDEPYLRLSPGFAREFARMPREQRRAFRAAVEKLIGALREGADPPHSPRIKRVQGTKDVWEMSYSGDGRATFRYGSQVKPSETHVEWLRVGGHEILSRPQ
jgi:hypothetical protein